MAKKKDELTSRMKEYENRTKFCFAHSLSDVILVRLDGKNCSKWTKDFAKPYDHLFSRCMKEALLYLVENVPNCLVGWQHSDEISIAIQLPTEESEYWFGGSLQKIVSITASMATMKFNQEFYNAACRAYDKKGFSGEQVRAHENSAMEGLIFDGRAFMLPLEELPNYLLCRQRDCIRNSIEGTARTFFSHNQMQNKNGSELKEMLQTEKGVDWEKDYPNDFKYGVLAYKVPKPVESANGITYRHEWKLSEVTPKLNYWNQSFLGKDYYESIT